MEALIIVINILLILTALVLIVSVLMQEGNRAGLGAIGGGAETFFGKSKAKSVQAKLQMITKIGAVVFIVLAIVCTALVAYQDNVENARLEAEQAQALAELEATAGDDIVIDGDAVIVPETEVEAEPEAGTDAEPATEPEAEPAAEPAAEPEAEPAAEPASEPEAEPAAEPASEPEAEPTVAAE